LASTCGLEWLAAGAAIDKPIAESAAIDKMRENCTKY
jgi:hypothetical protein